ncbi:MAG: transporter substrate-binding domain-containing protein [Xanthobacteraceae bacterium]
MQLSSDPNPALPDLVAMLAGNGTLRAGLNLANKLLVSGKDANGEPVGVAPDLARALASRLGVAVSFIGYALPGPLSDAVAQDEWDIAMMGAEPQRAAFIGFTPAYVEIEATYLIPAGSPLRGIADVDAPGLRIAVSERAAFGLWLQRNIASAELALFPTIGDATAAFVEQKLDALAGLRPGLEAESARIPGSTVLAGHYMSVQQAIGVPKAKSAAVPFLSSFLVEARQSGLLADLLRRHRIEGLTIA